MTLILAIQVQDGVVLASDSAMSHRGHTYFNAEKLVPVARGLPVGLAICGDGALGSVSVSSLLEDFESNHLTSLDRSRYDLRDLVAKLGDFLEATAAHRGAVNNTSLILGGYSAGSDLPETWTLQVKNGRVSEISQVWNSNSYGVNWDGQGACIHRLLMDLALPSRPAEPLHEARAFKTMMEGEQAIQTDSPVLVTPGMPILDAVEIARFLLETSITFEQYRADQPAQILGGPIDIAVITRHKGFRWIQRKRHLPGRRKGKL